MLENTMSINKLTKQSSRLRLIGLASIFISFVSLLIITTNQLNKIKNARKELSLIANEIDSLKVLRDSIRLEYLEAKGFNPNKRQELLDESIKANELLSQLLKSESIDRNLIIKYYRKSLDQEKVWLSLKELGYKKLIEAETTNSVLVNDETNTIAIGTQVPLADIKVIALTLIRAGFKVQHLYYAQRNRESTNLVQIIRTAPSDGSPDRAIPITVEKIKKAKNVTEILH